MLARNAAPLPFGSDPLVRCNINRIRNRIVPDSQAKVSDGTRAILLHQDVLGFQVSVSNARLSYENKTISSREQGLVKATRLDLMG